METKVELRFLLHHSNSEDVFPTLSGPRLYGAQRSRTLVYLTAMVSTQVYKTRPLS